MDVNYYCTSVSGVNGIEKPTFWFDSSIAHGVVDFLGVQTALAEVYGRNSCSYDPPNFGWSSNLPAYETDFYVGYEPLLAKIGREDEEKVLVGWAGGITPIMRQAIKSPATTRGLVLLEPAPYGIEWLDMQRELNWTTQQMLSYRDSDMAGRLSIARTILMLALPW
jgi:hypothetical protein